MTGPRHLSDEELADNPAHDFAEAIMDYVEAMTPLLRPTDFHPLIARKLDGRGPSRLMLRRPALHGWAMGSSPLLAQLIELDAIGDDLLEPCDAAVYLLGSNSRSVTTPRWFAVSHAVIKVRLGKETRDGRHVFLTACSTRTFDFVA